MARMRAARYYSSTDIRIEEVPVPQIGHNDVRLFLKWKTAASCASGRRSTRYRKSLWLYLVACLMTMKHRWTPLSASFRKRPGMSRPTGSALEAI